MGTTGEEIGEVIGEIRGEIEEQNHYCFHFK